MMALLAKFGPWLAAIGAIIFGLFRHQQAKTATAEAKQEVAEIKQKTAETNAAAAQSGADAAKERIDVENDIVVRPAGDSEQRLRDHWSRD
jgi:hypothetical protein